MQLVTSNKNCSVSPPAILVNNRQLLAFKHVGKVVISEVFLYIRATSDFEILNIRNMYHSLVPSHYAKVPVCITALNLLTVYFFCVAYLNSFVL